MINEAGAPLLEVGQRLEPLEIIDMTVQGGGVARHQGQVVFLESGILGETVAARVTQVKKRVVQATVEEVLTPSPHAVAPTCPHFALCGGCSWQNLSLAAQHEWKQRHVRETLARIGKTVVDVAPVAASPLSLGYRNKVAFAFAKGPEGAPVLGLRQKGSHNLVEVDHCPLLPERGRAVLHAVRQLLEARPIPAYSGPEGYLRFLVLHLPQYTPEGLEQCVVEIITAPANFAGNKQYVEAVHILADTLVADAELGISGVAHTQRKDRAAVAQGEKVVYVAGVGAYLEEIGHITLSAPHSVFLQTNTGAAGVLYAAVAEAAALTGEEKVWDLYCGVGSVGLFLGEKAASVRGFDIQPDAIGAANSNAKRLKLRRCKFMAGDMEKLLGAEVETPDVIVVDPPRAGLDAAVVRILRDTAAKKLIYISCDIGTQARDVALLQPWWQAERAIPVDMFPHTPHVENILVLTRQS